MLSLKDDTVNTEGLKPELLLAIQVVYSVYRDQGVPCVITSLNDGGHMPGSKHFKCEAADFRTKNIAEMATKRLMARLIHEALGKDYDVLFESPEKPNEHFHVEWDKK